MPILKPTSARANVAADSVCKPPVKSSEVDTDDEVGLAFERQPEELVKNPPKLENILQNIGKSYDRVLRHIQKDFDSGGCHPGSSSSKKTRVQCALQGLIVIGRGRFKSG